MLNVESVRKDFPILDCEINGKPLVYFDSAATTLRPKQVVDRISEHYLYETSNVHRGVHFLSQQATQNFEDAREKVANFINAANFDEISFNSGTTMASNFVAETFLRPRLKKGDVVLAAECDHHSNIVPWQIACERTGAQLKPIKLNEDGTFNLEHLKELLKENVKFVAAAFVSNTLGTILPIKEITQLVHEAGAHIYVDAAQAIAHQKIDVQDLDCDFLSFSSHKMFGPTGIGALYGRRSILKDLPPFFVGGGMVETVRFDKTTFNNIPFRFEAGTPHIAGAIGTAAAIDYIQSLGFDNIWEHEHRVTNYCRKKIQTVEGSKIYGPENQGPIVSFNIGSLHPTDVGSLLDQYGIAVRTGRHCTEPLMDKYQVKGMVRASFCIYNTEEEVDYFVDSLKKVIKMLE